MAEGCREEVDSGALCAELAEALAAGLSERPQRCGHSSDPMCCPYENFPTLAAFFKSAETDAIPPDVTRVFCEHGHHFQDPEPCSGCWPKTHLIPPNGTDEANPITHRPGCSWETAPYCDCTADPERAAPAEGSDA